MNLYRIREKSEYGTSVWCGPDLPEMPFDGVMNQNFVFGVSLLTVDSGCHSNNDTELPVILIVVMIVNAK